MPRKILSHMPHTRIAVIGLGNIARQVLSQAHEAIVWGITRSGAFLHLPEGNMSSPDGWVVFLTSEPFRGPLTLNIDTHSRPWQGLSRGLPLKVDKDSLYFESAGLTFCIDETATWAAPQRGEAASEQLDLRSVRMEDINRRILAAHPALAWEAENRTLEQYLGLGEGLTPAGDDITIGFLLAANRWGDILLPNQDVPAINRAILDSASHKTSTLSANLILCATQGQADERLILALDGMMTGRPDPETCAAYLLSWGSSSGAYAWKGMCLAMRAAISVV